LILGLIVGEIVQRLQHQHLEHQRDVMRLAPCIAPALLLMKHLQERAEGFPVDDMTSRGSGLPRFSSLANRYCWSKKPGWMPSRPCLISRCYAARSGQCLEVHLSCRGAWDVAAYMNSYKRAQDPRHKGNLKATTEQFHGGKFGYYGTRKSARRHLLGGRPAGQ
jgi:hypothetical protein